MAAAGCGTCRAEVPLTYLLVSPCANCIHNTSLRYSAMSPNPKAVRTRKQSTVQSAVPPPASIPTDSTEGTPLFRPGPSGTHYSDSDDDETATTREAPAPPRPNIDCGGGSSESEPGDDVGYDSDDDPVVREYDICMTEVLAANLHLFQFPVRPKNQLHCKGQGSCPVGARWKPKAGLVEVDVPVNTALNFDQEKGRVWGDALRKSQQAKESGLPGKTIGARGGKRRRVKGEDGDDEDDEDDMIFVDFQEAVKKGRVLNKQTLGSKIQADESKYMLGVFLGSRLSGRVSPPTLFLRCSKPLPQTSYTSRRSAPPSSCGHNSTMSMRNTRRRGRKASLSVMPTSPRNQRRPVRCT